jgi:hypothetical protein
MIFAVTEKGEKMKTTELEIIEKAISTYGVEQQADMAIEEMSELIKALLKYRRAGQKADVSHYAAVKEEVADVEIMLDQLKLMFFDVEDAPTHNEFKEFKLIRLANRLGIDVNEVNLNK